MGWMASNQTTSETKANSIAGVNKRHDVLHEWIYYIPACYVPKCMFDGG